MKTNIYNEVLSIVVEVTEISKEQILSRDKRTEVVEARTLLFFYLWRMGFAFAQISRMTGLTRQCVSMRIYNLRNRCKAGGKMLSILMTQIEKAMTTKRLMTAV